MLDVTAVAHGNNAARQASADAAIAGDASGALSALRALVAGSAVSTNVSADKLFAYDGGGGVLHTREVAVQVARGDVAAGLAAFAADQKGGLARREAFEDLWDHGRRFVYGAVNAGGMGTEGRFGPFCLVLTDPEQPRPAALAVFPADTASRYANDAGDVDDVTAASEATSWAARGDLAVNAFGDRAVGLAVAAWPELICRPGQYMEVVRAGELPVEQVSELRLRAAFRTELIRLWEDANAGEVQLPADANLAAAYDVVLRWQKSHGLAITEVDDA